MVLFVTQVFTKNSNKTNLILYNTTNGIIVLKIYVYVDNYIIAKTLKSMWIFLWRKIGYAAIKEGLISLANLFSKILLQNYKKKTFKEKWYASKTRIGRYGIFH